MQRLLNIYLKHKQRYTKVSKIDR